MGSLLHTLMYGSMNIVATGDGPRRASSRRTDIPSRGARPLVTGRSPDGRPYPAAPGGVPVLVQPPTPARPFALYTMPRRRMGPVPKLAPGHQGTGLGRPVMAGFQSPEYPGFSPMDYAPDTNPDRSISIPKAQPWAYQTGKQIAPTYNAHDFTPAQRFFSQNRSSGLWAQASFPPQQRVLTPSQQAPMLKRPAMFARRQIPAGQPNPGIYTFGYPTSIGVAARLGGGPIAVLGGNSQ